MKNSFVVNYSAHLWLIAMGVSISGPWGLFLGYILKGLLGSLLDKGIIELDIAIDKRNEALKDPRWREAALKAYKNATAKVLTEAEKNEVRKQYMAALNQYATFISMPDNQNP